MLKQFLVIFYRSAKHFFTLFYLRNVSIYAKVRYGPLSGLQRQFENLERFVDVRKVVFPAECFSLKYCFCPAPGTYLITISNRLVAFFPYAFSKRTNTGLVHKFHGVIISYDINTTPHGIKNRSKSFGFLINHGMLLSLWGVWKFSC